MAEGQTDSSRPTDKVGRVLYDISRGLAVIGGVLLCAMALLTTISVTGRSAFSAPIPGDFELVAIGTGLAVFSFLPWCQMNRGNVIVDFFMNPAPVRAKTVCDIIGGFFYLMIAILLTWRMIFGGLDMYNYDEMSMTINFPRWTTFPVSILMMAFLVIVIAYTIRRSILETRQGRFLDQPNGSDMKPGG